MNLKFLTFIISSLLIIFVGYTNCAKKIDFNESESSFNSNSVNLGQDCIVCGDQDTYLIPMNNSISIADQSNILNLDSRETYESYFHLLNYDYYNLTPSLFTQLTNERFVRRALLAQDNTLNTMTPVNVLSQFSIASEVCRLTIYDQLMKNKSTIQYFENIDFSQEPILIALNEQESQKKWMNSVNSLAEVAWGRSTNETEALSFIEYINNYFSEYKNNPNKTAKDGSNGKNLQTLSLAISICTAVLSAPEASLK